jgi:hypothetical protein
MRAWVLVALGAMGCGETDPHPPPSMASPVEPAPEAPPEPAGCVAPDGMGAPSSIQDAVDLLNALPEASVPCLVEALDRPLTINATRGLISAQPAVSAQDPRIFIFSGDLVLSIVTAGAGRDLLEFGEQRGPIESLKGELHMPATQPIPPAKPFEHLRYNADLTSCGICHRDERLAPDAVHENAYLSRPLRPVDAELVGLDVLRGAHANCDAAADPERCAIFDAIFDHGPVIWRDFSPEMDTIFDR